MSHLNDVGVSRQYDRSNRPYILTSISARSGAACTEKRIWKSSSVSALTVCVWTSHEDVRMRPIKFNDAGCTRAGRSL